MTVPSGEERKVKFLGSAAIDGAPVAYIVVLAAVVAALCFVPFSMILAVGGSFPMAQGIFPLVGWILGPVAGAVASGVGRAIGVFVAPHTAGVAVVSIWAAMLGSFSAGVMDGQGKRKTWWLPLTVFFVLEWVLFAGRAVIQNGVGLWAAFAGSFIDWSGVVLFALPTRTLAARWLKSQNMGQVVAGLFLGTWMIAGVTHLSATVILYFMSNWPEDVWITLIPIIPMENLFRCLIGTVIGSGVIAGLRAIGIVKPTEATY